MNNRNDDNAKTKTDDDFFKSFSAFVKEFKDESDRAAVIIGTAKLDYLLYQVLTKYLVPNAGNSDDLLEGDSPLSTFSSRINICFRLGLIDAKFARALHLTRKIRNSFAHEISGCKLDSGPHRDRIRELVSPFNATDAFMDYKKTYVADKSGSAADFFTALGIMILTLEGLFEHSIPLTGTNAFTIPHPQYVSPFKVENPDSVPKGIEATEAK